MVGVTPPQLAGARIRPRRSGQGWEVRVERLQELRSLAVMSVGAALLTDVELTIARWSAPSSGWLGHPRIPGLTLLQIEPTDAGVRLRAAVATPTDASILLAGCVRSLMPVAVDVGPQLTFGPGLPEAAGMLAGRLHDVLVPGEDRDPHVRRADTLILPADPPSANRDEPVVAAADTVRVGNAMWSRDGLDFLVCVDPSVQRPLGRRSTGGTSVASATVTGGVVTVTGTGERIVLGRAVTASSTRALRSIGAIVSGDLPESVVHQLHACGVLVVDSADDLPAPDEHLAWQARSVHERRHALRQYGPSAALDDWPSVSVLLVTHRADFLDHAIEQLRRLSYPRLQIVLGLHGDQVDQSAWADRLREVPHPSVVVDIEGTATLGEALQRAADRAEGSLVTKMDDDDHYGPEHIWDLVLARQYSGAQVVGKALDWIHLASSDVTVFRPTYPAEKYADFVAGGTILISRADLAAVGGWRPVPKSVDRALLDRVLQDGGLVYRTHGLGYIYTRRASGHTATVRDEHFLTKVERSHTGLIRHEAFGTTS